MIKIGIINNLKRKIDIGYIRRYRAR